MRAARLGFMSFLRARQHRGPEALSGGERVSGWFDEIVYHGLSGYRGGSYVRREVW